MKLMPSSPPHIRSQDSNATVMFYVICALGSLYLAADVRRAAEAL